MFDVLASTVMSTTTMPEVTWSQELEPLRDTTTVKIKELINLIYHSTAEERQKFNDPNEYTKNITDNNLLPILMEAIRQQDTELVEILLAFPYNAPINIANSDGKTPIIIAIEQQNQELVGLLLNCKDIELDGSAIIAAINTNNEDILNLLLDSPYLDLEKYKDTQYELPTSGQKVTIAQYAILINNTEAINEFVNLGLTNPNLLTDNQSTLSTESTPLSVDTLEHSNDPLNENGQLAVVSQQYKELELINQALAPQTSAQQPDSLSPSINTTDQKNTKKLINNTQSMLIKHINMVRNETKLKAIEGLLKLPDYQDLSKTDIQGNTALHAAIINKHIPQELKIKLITLLLQHGADIRQKNRAQKSPYDIAIATHNKPLLALLAEHEQKTKPPKTETKLTGKKTTR